MEYEWHEINVFIDTEEDETRIANILGRDITEAHNIQERNEKELRAAASLDPEYIPQFAALANLEALRARTNANGLLGTLSMEYLRITARNGMRLMCSSVRMKQENSLRIFWEEICF